MEDKKRKHEEDGHYSFKRIGSGRYDSLQEQREREMQKEKNKTYLQEMEERKKRIEKYISKSS